MGREEGAIRKKNKPKYGAEAHSAAANLPSPKAVKENRKIR